MAHDAESSGREQLARLSRVYSDETWRVYERLDRSLNPRGPEWLRELAGRYLQPRATVLDAGCRDAAHLIRLVQTHNVSGAGIDPVGTHVAWARAAVTDSRLDHCIEIVQATLAACPFPDRRFDLIWCRDVLEQVKPLAPALREIARVLKPDGRLLVFTVIATDLLAQDEATMLRRHLGNVEANLVEANLEAAFDAAGLTVEVRDAIGTEWREHAEEQTQPVSKALLRLARLRRQRSAIIEEHGEDIYLHVEANLHWEVFQFLGKLRPMVYVLRHHPG